MKTRIIIAYILCIFSSTAALAQDDAFFIYRNDGDFNAFFDNEVDSITYSHYDADSLYHSDWQMQVIYTADSIYQIPLEVIDSVAFAKRQNVYAENVVLLNPQTFIDYILDCEGTTLYYNKETPIDSLPQIGDILFAEQIDHPIKWPGGKVISIESDDYSYIVTCEEIKSLDELYESFTSICEYELEENDYYNYGEESEYDSSYFSLRPITRSPEFELGNSYSYHYRLGNDFAQLDAVYTGSTRVKAIIRYDKNHPFYADLSTTFNHKIETGVRIEKGEDFSLNENRNIKILSINVPIPNCPMLRFKFMIYPFLKGELKGSLDFEFGASSTTTNGVIFRQGQEPLKYSVFKAEHEDDNINYLNINGEIFGGIACCSSLGTIGDIVKAEAEVSLGPKFTCDFPLSNITDNTIKDSKITYSICANMEAKASAKVLSWECSRIFAEESFDLKKSDWYFAPIIDESSTKFELSENNNLHAKFSYELLPRNIYFPWTVLLTIDEKKVGSEKYSRGYFHSDEYEFINCKYTDHNIQDTERIKYEFQPSTFFPGVKYLVYPTINIDTSIFSDLIWLRDLLNDAESITAEPLEIFLIPELKFSEQKVSSDESNYNGKTTTLKYSIEQDIETTEKWIFNSSSASIEFGEDPSFATVPDKCPRVTITYDGSSYENKTGKLSFHLSYYVQTSKKGLYEVKTQRIYYRVVIGDYRSEPQSIEIKYL